MTELLNPETDNLTIALDENQNLYQKRSSWKDLGVKARGRVHRIDYVYRNTIEITDFANGFIGYHENGDSSDPSQLTSSPTSSIFTDHTRFSGNFRVWMRQLRTRQMKSSE